MRTLAGERRGSLLDAIDRGVTSAARDFSLKDCRRRSPIPRRSRAGSMRWRVRRRSGRARRHPFAATSGARSRRALARLAVGRGGPRDLAAIRDGVLAAADLARALGSLKDTPAEIADALQSCRRPDGMPRGRAVGRAGGRAAGVQARRRLCARGLRRRARRDAGVARRIRAAWLPPCRRATPRKPACAASRSATTMCSAISSRSPPSTATKLMAAPLNATFIHRQTLAGQVRFTSTELGELEAKIASAAERSLGLELEIFERLAAAVIADSARSKLAPRRSPVLTSPARLPSLRLSAAMRADRRRQPRLRDRGRPHPVVEQALARDGTPFVANDCDLSPPARRRPAASGCSPAPTWRANLLSCGRTH